MNSAVRAALVGLAVASLLTVALPADEPVASACGWDEDIIDLGTVHVYMICTQPHVDVHPDRDPSILG